jgi:hypothetical protein
MGYHNKIDKIETKVILLVASHYHLIYKILLTRRNPILTDDPKQ